MRHIIIYTTFLLCGLAMMLTSCKDDTGSLGIYPENDGIYNSIAIYEATTKSILLDSVIANSTSCYLGNVADSETGTSIEADFAAQFATLEDYKLPSTVVLEEGKVVCDSVEVRLYFDKYYGNGNNPMKVEVYEMSKEKILHEDSVYYTSVDLTKYLPAGAKPLASRVCTPMDYNIDESDLTSSTHSHNLHISLPVEFGQNILQKCYEHKGFPDSYYFTHNVLPGLYFKASGGQGTMLKVYVGTLNVHFRYKDGSGKIVTGMARFSATPEVIQSTHFENNGLDGLIADNTHTYLMTPAGICTEMTLPIDEVFSGAHSSDSISLASLTITRENNTSKVLGTPQTLLMVRKQDAKAFFASNNVSNRRTSYTTAFSSVYNTYTFDNICRLLSYCKHEKIDGAKAAGQTEDEWATEHPDWNKVLLIPVTVSTESSSNAEVSVNHELNLTSARLVGGNTTIPLQIIYSKFKQQ